MSVTVIVDDSYSPQLQFLRVWVTTFVEVSCILCRCQLQPVWMSVTTFVDVSYSRCRWQLKYFGMSVTVVVDVSNSIFEWQLLRYIVFGWQLEPFWMAVITFVDGGDLYKVRFSSKELSLEMSTLWTNQKEPEVGGSYHVIYTFNSWFLLVSWEVLLHYPETLLVSLNHWT